MAAATEATQSHILKVLVLGDTATGKTSIIKRYVHNFFSGHYKTTVGVDFHLKQLQMDVKDPVTGAVTGTQTVKLQLWDIAGQDRFGAISRVYYKDALGALLVYDLSRRETYENAKKWKDEIESKVLLPNGLPIPVVLLANKCDLEGIEIDTAELEKFVSDNKFLQYFPTSAKDGTNIDNACRALVEKILSYDDIFNVKKTTEGVINPGANTKSTKSSGCC